MFFKSLQLVSRCGVISLCSVTAFWAVSLISSSSAFAQPISNPVGVYKGLDKLTGRITDFDAYVGETIQFGSLQLTMRACNTRPKTQNQQTSAFVEVDSVDLLGKSMRIFTGWMFADSPALHAIDDAVFDIWLVDCKRSSEVPVPNSR